MKTNLQAVELVRRQVMLGSLLKAIRNERGGIQLDYALKLGSAKPTFLCNVEKGTSSIPQSKINDYAKVYLPEEKEKLASAIVYFVIPEIWNVIMGSLQEPLANEMTNDVKNWLEEKFKKYNITEDVFREAA